MKKQTWEAYEAYMVGTWMVPYYPLQVTRIIDKSLTQFCVGSTVLSMKDGGSSPSEVCQWPESG